MHLRHLLAAAAACTAPLFAQGVQATSAGLWAQVGSAPAVTIAPGIDVTGAWSGTASGAAGTAAFAVVTQTSTAELQVELQVSAAALATGQVQAGGELRCTLWAPEPVSGVLTAVWLPTLSGTGALECSVDVHDDGNIEAQGAASWPLQCGPTPLVLRLRATAAASAGTVRFGFGSSWTYRGAAQGVLRVSFAPLPLHPVPVANGCGAPQLQATSNLLGGADLLGEGCAPHGLAAAVLGWQGPALPLPLPPHCSLAVLPAAVVWLIPDAAGAWRWSFGLPATARPLGLDAQWVAVDPALGTAWVSPALHLDCR
jgi:hypothetical protein